MLSFLNIHFQNQQMILILILSFVTVSLYCCVSIPTVYDRKVDDEQQELFLRKNN